MEALKLRKHIDKEVKLIGKKKFKKFSLIEKFSYIHGVASWQFSFLPSNEKENLAVKELRGVEENAKGLLGLYLEYEENKRERDMKDMENRLPYFLDYFIARLNLASHYLSWSE